MFQQLLPSFQEKVGMQGLDIPDFDWALHPGGEAIIEGAKEMLHLTENQLRASREIYKTRGNSSSPTVLAVLDKLRSMGRGRDHVVATSFGPGLAIEMAMLRRCRPKDDDDDDEYGYA
jgi:fungal type III polyketide synthase